MTQIDTKDIRWQQEIDLYNEELVETADRTLPASRVQTLKRSMKLAQLNNLLGVALEAQGTAIVSNWVNYQMGRRETERAWQDSGFGAAVQKDLETIRGFAETIVDTVYEADSQRRRRIQRTHIMLVRLYIGYLKRWFIARGGQQGS